MPCLCFKPCVSPYANYCLFISLIILNADVSGAWSSLANNDVMISSHSQHADTLTQWL